MLVVVVVAIFCNLQDIIYQIFVISVQINGTFEERIH